MPETINLDTPTVPVRAGKRHILRNGKITDTPLELFKPVVVRERYTAHLGSYTIMWFADGRFSLNGPDAWDCVAVYEDELRRLIAVVEEKLATIPAIKIESLDPTRAAHAAGVKIVVDALTRDEGAKIKANWTGATVTLAGIRSSSTSGIAGALNNWVRAAQLKLKMEDRNV